MQMGFLGSCLFSWSRIFNIKKIKLKSPAFGETDKQLKDAQKGGMWQRADNFVISVLINVRPNYPIGI